RRVWREVAVEIDAQLLQSRAGTGDVHRIRPDRMLTGGVVRRDDRYGWIEQILLEGQLDVAATERLHIELLAVHALAACAHLRIPDLDQALDGAVADRLRQSGSCDLIFRRQRQRRPVAPAGGNRVGPVIRAVAAICDGDLLTGDEAVIGPDKS